MASLTTPINMKRKISLIDPIDNPVVVIAKRFTEKRTRILKQSREKLNQIPDATQCLRQAVLIRNTFIRAKNLSPETFERQLSQPNMTVGSLLKDNSDLLRDLIVIYNPNDDYTTPMKK